jgi:hypothetical protein
MFLIGNYYIRLCNPPNTVSIAKKQERIECIAEGHREVMGLLVE